MEKWKDIPSYEGYYQVSDLGRVKSLSRTVKYKNGNLNKFKGKILNLGVDSYGYLRVTLSKNGKRKIGHVHKLVAIAFLNHSPNKYIKVVDHIDNNKLNNKLENIQIVTNRINTTKDRVRKEDLPTGVYTTKSGKYRSMIRIKGKQKHLGTFNTPEEANKAYQNSLTSHKTEGGVNKFFKIYRELPHTRNSKDCGE